MSAFVDTSVGEEGSQAHTSKLKACIATEFKDDVVSNNIYSKLVEMEIEDIQTLILTDLDDLNELCEDMNLKGAKKIKFKALVRKQKQIYQPQPQSMIAISTKEQTDINKLEQTIKQSYSMQQALESYMNQIEQHSIDTVSIINHKFDIIFKSLQQRQKILNNKVADWKSKTLEQTNAKVVDVIKYCNDLKQGISDINKIIQNDKSINKQRENEIRKIAQKYENHQHYQTFSDNELFIKYIENNTKLFVVDFDFDSDGTGTGSLDNWDWFGVTNANGTNDRFSLPCIQLNEIQKTEESDKRYKVSLQWDIDIITNPNETNFVVKYMEADDEKQMELMEREWVILDDVKVETITKNKYCVNVPNWFILDKVYKYQIDGAIAYPFPFTIHSNVQQLVIDITKEQRIELKVHSHKGDQNDPPSNLLKSTGSYYHTHMQVTDDWIVFCVADSCSTLCYIPTKVKIQTDGSVQSMKDFNILCGNVATNQWVKCNKMVMSTESNITDFQSFGLDVHVDKSKYQAIKQNAYKHYKLEILNNHGDTRYICAKEFQLFGVSI